MLLNFKWRNFRSFKETAEFLMRPSLSQKTLSENLLIKDDIKALPTAVIYGANASGKTNFIKALQCLQNIIRRGDVSSEKQSYSLGLLAFIYNFEKNDVMEFEIEFEKNGLEFRYGLMIKIDPFKTEGVNRILYEELTVLKLAGISSPVTLFKRSENDFKEICNIEKSKTWYKKKDVDKKIYDAIRSNLSSTDLFLTGGFKNSINNTFAQMAINFILEDLYVIDSFNQMSLKISREQQDDSGQTGEAFTNENMNDIIKKITNSPQTIGFRNDGEMLVPVSLYENKKRKKGLYMFPADFMESKGTMNIFNMLVVLLEEYPKGKVFVLDEFDASIHSEIVKGIISVFNNPEINIGCSQLIFTTHNPIYLSNKIFRRDQIVMVEKDEEDYSSSIYKLSDFGSKEVRNDDNYMKCYFKGKYGALPYIDFTSEFKEAVGLHFEGEDEDEKTP